MNTSHRIAAAALLAIVIAPFSALASAQERETARQEAPLESPRLTDGARVRITAGPLVELPGVVRFEGTTPRANGAIVNDEENTVSVRVDGRPDVTVLRPLRRAVGVISQSDSGRVLLHSETGAPITIPRQAVARYEVSNGRASRLRNIFIGLAIGAGAGAAIGYATRGEGCHDTPSQFMSGCFMEPEASIFAGFLIGGGSGALVGTFLPRPERWKTRPSTQLPDSAQ